MRSNYKRLGDYIKEVNNRDTKLEVDLLLGVSIQKKFIPSIANTIGTDMSTYKIIKRNQFAYGPVTSRNGDKISIALLEDCDEAIVSQAYTPFEVKDTNELLPEYLMMWFRWPEFDRYARFKSHGSAREIFGWEVGQLKEMSEFIIAGVIPKYTDQGCDFVLGQKCVHDNYVDLHFARPHIPKDNCLLIKFGDILINSTGTGTLGRVGQVYFEPRRLAYDSNMTLVRGAKECYIDYLGCFLSQKESYFIQISQGSTNQTRLYCSMINPVEILIPDEIVLIAFKEKVRNIKLLTEKIRDENTLLCKFKDLLLSKLATIEN